MADVKSGDSARKRSVELELDLYFSSSLHFSHATSRLAKR